ncbi:FtsQ-type POTRA domain-containing protein [Akkermansiaceae bacterium]|nr:FtsQ-type POTRA domain-containing protein [Akkermansiaceae bacterium]MDA8975916.1 FtsQ-type POTRA domain-containing protein [Akkermansiaceae bacterium]MDB4412674.1 FtsQ-type POTRA domain-containing protein [bacterium]MDB4506934.1 FtsQ-type POTRA domain-containing protein [Akkermansiaceae bacterium]
MFTKRTSRRTTKSRERMLELRVNSPRILLCDAVKFSARLLKFGVFAGIVAAFGFALHLGYQKIFIENQEFALHEIPVTTPEGHEPQFMTIGRIMETTGIDADASIFAFDIDDVEASLANLPELSGATVTRRLPDILKVQVTERIPVAWLACPSLGIEERSVEKGLLVDASGFAFRCATKPLADFAAELPVVFASELPAGAIVSGEKIDHEGLSYALELAQNADGELSGDDLPNWVMVKDEITLEMMTIGGIRSTFSYFDQVHQLTKFHKVTSHARERGRELATINLIPNRYVPVTYRGTN